METNRIIRGFFILLIAVTLLTGWLGFWILHQTGLDFAIYPCIPLYFFVFGSCYILVMKKASKQSAKAMLVSFMGIRMAKLLMSVLLLILYGVFVYDSMKELVLTFLSFYLIYLLLEVGLFLYFRKSDKES